MFFNIVYTFMHIHKAISGLKMRLTFKFTIFYFNWSLFVCRNIRIGNAYSMNETHSFFFALSLSSKYSDSWDCFFFEFRSLSFSFDLIPTENNFFFFQSTNKSREPITFTKFKQLFWSVYFAWLCAIWNHLHVFVFETTLNKKKCVPPSICISSVYLLVGRSISRLAVRSIL